ncbi:MAG TPA: glycosyltransferase family 39 protein [Candidatus Binatia bacterium]|jgi:undecaprenyl-diphosphatase|nr:glycosyltransferase family 39 protein [Candidatus Binatia bacterium]
MKPQSRLCRSGYYRNLAILLLLALTLFHLWYIGAGFLDLAPDEAHYWEWSRRLDLSYYSKGPMVAYLIAASTRLCGNTEFCVRLPAALMALGTVSVIFLLARRLFASERAGFLAVLACSAIPLYAAGSILMTIDAPLAFFWALALFGVQRATSNADGDSQETTKNWGWWFLFGCALGLGLQSKYSMALFLLCLSLYMVLTPRARSCLKEKRLYFALLLGVALFTPVIVWNARHDWVSLWHVMGQAGLLDRGAGFSTKSFLEFLGSQIGVVSPLLFFALVAALVRSGRLGLADQKDPHLFLFLFSSPFLAFFLLWSLYQKVQANWAAVGYLAVVVALAGWWDELLNRAGNGPKRFFLNGIFSTVLLPGALLVALGHFPGLLEQAGIDLPVQIDPTKRLKGWKELGMAVGKIREESPDREVFLVSDSYQIASEMAFYVPGQPRVYNINLGRRMNQYDIWGGLDNLRGKNLLFVTYHNGKTDPILQDACRKVEKVKDVKIFYRKYPAQFFSVFFCGQYRGTSPPGKPTH